MAKQIIILNKAIGANGSDQNIEALFWLPVTANQQVPLPTAVSAFRGASAAELSAIKAGTVIERAFSAQYPAAFTAAQIQTALQTAFTVANTAFQGQPNPNTLYGQFFDGTIWNAAAQTVFPGVISSQTYGHVITSTAGDNTIIAGVALQSVSLTQFKLSVAGAVTLLFKDGATTIDGFVFGAADTKEFPATYLPWYVFSPGNAFVMNLSAAVNVAISGWFTQA